MRSYCVVFSLLQLQFNVCASWVTKKCISFWGTTYFLELFFNILISSIILITTFLVKLTNPIYEYTIRSKNNILRLLRIANNRKQFQYLHPATFLAIHSNLLGSFFFCFNAMPLVLCLRYCAIRSGKNKKKTIIALNAVYLKQIIREYIYIYGHCIFW